MRGFRAVALGAALLGAGAAQAQGLDYDCDTTPEHFSERKAPLRTGAQTISGSMTVRDMYRSRKYGTSGDARIGDVDGNWSVRIRLAGEVRTSKTDLELKLLIKRPGETREEFALPGGQPSQASVVCSTGDVLFSNLSFGS